MGKELDRIAMATVYRTTGQNQHSLELSCELIRGMHSWQTEWLEMATNISICAYYVPRAHELGRLACEALLSNHDKFVDHERAVANASWYAPCIEIVNKGKFNVGDNPYRPTNPCIVLAGEPETERKPVAIIRLVNYAQERGRAYRSDDPDGKIRTRNLLHAAGRFVRIDDFLVGPEWVRDSEIQGLEDIRVVYAGGCMYFTATSCCAARAPTNTNFGKVARWPRVVIGRIESGKFVDVHPMPAFRNACEKNWIPFVSDEHSGVVLLAYSWDPFTILRPNPQTGEYAVESSVEPAWWAKSWRGGSQGVAIEDKRIAIVHEVARRDNENVYTHRFVEWHHGALTRYSAPFVFDHQGVEYCCGLARRANGNFVASYGFEDREARWCEVEGATVEAMLRTPSEVTLEFEAAVGAA